MKIIHIKLTDDDHINLKVTAMTEGTTMQSFVENLIKGSTKIPVPPSLTKKEFDQLRQVPEKVSANNAVAKSALYKAVGEKMDAEEALERTVSRKNIIACQHGAAIGLCKFGCKK